MPGRGPSGQPSATEPGDIPAMLKQALALHQQGAAAEARSLCRGILERAPHHFGALYLMSLIAAGERRFEESDRMSAQALAIKPDSAGALGSRAFVMMQLGRTDEALAGFGHSLALNPRQADAWCNRGNALALLQRPDGALDSYDHALAIRPDHGGALNNRASVLIELGRLTEALATYDRALANQQSARTLTSRALLLTQLARWPDALASFDAALTIEPNSAEALNGRGTCLMQLGRQEEALASFDEALTIRPEHIGALGNRGSVLFRLGRAAEALESYDLALALEQNSAALFSNRGVALAGLRRLPEALASFERALALKNDHAEALSNRATVLLGLAQPEAALASLERALASQPAFAEAWSNRGKVLIALSRFEEAWASYDRALAIRPDYPEALVNRAHALRQMRRHDLAAQTLERLVALDPSYPYAIGEMFGARLAICDWEGYELLCEAVRTNVRSGRLADFPQSFLSHSTSAADQLLCARTYVADRVPAAAQQLWSGEPYDHRKIRIAYVSSDFQDHPVAHAMVGLFELHDAQRFEVTAISLGRETGSDTQKRIRRAFHSYVDVRGKSDRDAARLIRDLEIDIAIDLNGFTAESRTGILAERPAPIQVSFMGYSATMGTPYIQYIIADRVVIPVDHRGHYSESIVYLPDTYMPTDPHTQVAPRVFSRAEAGLPASGFVFCSFNNSYKFTPEIFAIWMRILSRVPGSALWLLAANPYATENLAQQAELRGVSRDRLAFAPRMHRAEHLARHKLADLFLDTLPYNAHTSAADALWCGLPLVTCPGNTFVGRVASSLLHAVGLPDLVAGNLTEYEELAVKLATTPELLHEVRSRLQRNRLTHPLFDTDRFRRHVEAAYITMLERHRRGEPPASFAVPGDIGS